MSQQPTPISSLDDDVARLLDLNETIEQLNSQRETVKNRIRQRGLGTWTTTGGVTVAVTPAARRFNLDRAWTMLNAEQQALCTSPDAKKVKAQLAPALTEACMEPGSGQPAVNVK